MAQRQPPATRLPDRRRRRLRPPPPPSREAAAAIRDGAADFLAVSYFHALNYRPAEPEWEGRDRFCLSIGHYAIALYAALITLEVTIAAIVAMEWRSGRIRSRSCRRRDFGTVGPADGRRRQAAGG